MMLRGGDLNLNRSVQSFGDSTMERLKQAMLQHELMFRNQVCELHRLYWIQKNLMNELRIIGVDTDLPSSCPWLSKESADKKNAFSVFSRAKEARNVGALEEFKGKSTDLLKRSQRDFTLHLSADDFVRSNDKDPAFRHQASNFRCREVIDLESSVKLEFHEVSNDQIFSGGFRAPMQNSAVK